LLRQHTGWLPNQFLISNYSFVSLKEYATMGKGTFFKEGCSQVKKIC
jgi:hypothetical protein